MTEARQEHPSARPGRCAVGGDRPYDVVIGRRLLGELPALLGTGVAARPGASAPRR